METPVLEDSPLDKPVITNPAVGSLANLVIAGVPKAGTSSVFRWLVDHPQVQGASEKETYFFCDPGTHMYRPDRSLAAGLDCYREFFPSSCRHKPKIFCEATPSYIYSQTALENLPELPTSPKVVFILREPAAQIFSLYSYFKNNWDWIPRDMSFAEFVSAARQQQPVFKGNEIAQHAIQYADYLPYLTEWHARLGADRMRVWTFDELKNNSLNFMQRLADFCGIEKNFYGTYHFPLDNESYSVRNHGLQRVNLALRKRLPKGSLYLWMRKLYRKMNTEANTAPNQEERKTLEQLRDEFKPINAELAKTFNLDITNWCSGEH